MEFSQPLKFTTNNKNNNNINDTLYFSQDLRFKCNPLGNDKNKTISITSRLLVVMSTSPRMSVR